jgi:tRNA-2-methylthio-N6-dimethylallyladenosine synthase
LRRLRFTTSHPKDLSDQLIEAFGSLDKLVPHIHLPVQSGSDRVLKRMNRGYGRDFYLNKIEKLREARSDISITSDVMVGFPGEESVDYEDTLDLVRRVGFDSLFMFKYSDRPNVPAARFPKKIPDAVIGGRFSRLFGLQSELTLKKNKTLIGTVQEVLLEGHSKRMPDQLTGRTPCNRVVNFPDEGDSRVGVGQVLPVEIVEAFSHSLLGRRIAEAKREDAGAHGGMSHAA